MSGLLDDDAKWAGALSRDPAMDGRYFLAVRTTRIVCRPVCPARPHRKNVAFFDQLEDALAQGFRFCKRCKPELAPSSREALPNGALPLP